MQDYNSKRLPYAAEAFLLSYLCNAFLVDLPEDLILSLSATQDRMHLIKSQLIFPTP